MEIADHGYHDASLSYPVIIYVDIDKETMLYTFYDPYFDRSFVQKDGKIKKRITYNNKGQEMKHIEYDKEGLIKSNTGYKL